MARYLKFLIVLVSAVTFGLVSLPHIANSEEQSVGNVFIDLFNNNDKAGMEQLMKSRTGEVPDEVQSMVKYAMGPDSSKDEQDFLFNIAGTMSQMYQEATGDERLLGAVQQNYAKLLEERKASALPQDKVQNAKKALDKLGKGAWRIRTFKVIADLGLLIEIDVNDSASGGNFTPRIDFRTSQKAKEIVNKELPDFKEGKISWSSMGVGLKIIFLN
jgi:hypothetical protein